MNGVKFGAAALLMTASALSGAGCNNKRINIPKGGVGDLSTLLSTSTTASSAIVISQILLTSASPTTSIDVIGDGSGTMLNLCGSQSTAGATDCGCVFTYTTSAGGTGSFETSVSYVEANLIRCTYAGIPSDVPSTQVHIIQHSSNEISNSVTLALQGNAVALDPSNPATFVRVRRYQCRDILQIPNLLDGAVYDPFQSEDILNAYPRNYYASNFFNAMNYYTGLNTQGYECEFNGDTTNNWTSYPIYSAGADTSVTSANDRYVIYSPTAISLARYQFYLARQPAGSFSMPVNAITAPNIPTTVGSTALPPPIGYGVSPTSTGSGRETCPTTVPVTGGYAWKKLWLYQATLPSRSYVSASTGLKTMAGVACNPGGYQDATGTAIFPQCGTANGLYGGSPLYSRILGNGVCVNISPSSQITGNPIPLQADRWSTVANATNTGFCNTAAGGAMNVCANTSLNNSHPKAGNEPFDDAPTTAKLDADGTRTDYIFVVTPTTVNTADMEAGSYPQYRPVTYYVSSDCDATRAAAGTCTAAHRIDYTLKETAVATNSDNKTRAFPVCVLQKQ